jgi:hypothetical protein
LRTREASQVNSTKQLEESDTVLGELGKVLVDHVQCWFKYCFQDGGDLRSKERLSYIVQLETVIT